MVKDKKITVFGASGLVGSSIVRAALSKGYKVNGTMRNHNSILKSKVLKSLPNGEALKLFSADMSDYDTLEDPLKNSDAIFITCLVPTYFGFDGTPAKELDKNRGFKEIVLPTVNGALNILRQAKRKNIKNVVICSSTSSTNPIAPVAVKNEIDHWSDENQQYETKKFTSAAKTVMEKETIKYALKNNIRLSILLPTGLYGSAILPEHLKHNPFAWLKNCLKGGPPRHTATPNESASLIHLEDLSALFLAAYENPKAQGRYFGVERSYHWQEIYAACKKLIPNMQMPTPLTEQPRPVTNFDFRRRDSLGVKIRDFQTTLSQTIQWLKSYPL